MSEATQAPSNAEPVNPNVRFERHDVSIRLIVFAGVGLVVLTILTHLLLTGILAGISPPASPAGAAAISPERLHLPRDLQKVPAPRLQVNQAGDLEKLHQEEDAFLDNHSRAATWVDKGKVVRVPVAEAIRLLSDPKTAAALGVKAAPANAGKSAPKLGGASQ